MVRNPAEQVVVAVVGQAERRRVRGDGRHHARQERLVDRDARALERLRERLVVHRGRGVVAGLVAREGHDRRGRVLIEGQREEGHAQCRIGEAHGRAGIRRERGRAHAHARRHVGRGGAQHHEFRAAEIQEVVRRQHRDARRLEPHGHVARHRRHRLAQAEEHRPRRRHGDAWPCPPRGPAATSCRAGRITQRRSDVACFTSAALPAASSSENTGSVLPVLTHGGGQPREHAGRRVDEELERSGLADELVGAS